jgi:hypothetical protein
MGPELLGAVCLSIFERSENVATLPELLNEHNDLQAHHSNADDGGKDVEGDPPVGRHMVLLLFWGSSKLNKVRHDKAVVD